MDDVMAVVGELASAFAAAGHRLYLVGGVVRDLMLGSLTRHDDIDLTTDAHPTRIKALMAPLASDVWSQGERFGTIGARVRGRAVEVTTHRAEAYDPASRKPVVSFGHSIVEDLSRRDFTINAMAVSLPDRQLLDPYGGAADLGARRLRTPLSPGESFGDDPLRMLRAARFLPRFDLDPEPGLEAAAAELSPRLAIVSVERVRDELERLLAVALPARGLAFLHRTGLLGRAVPALAALGEAARAEACELAAAPGPPRVRRAGLLGPLGSEAAGAALAALRYPNAEADATRRLLSAVPAVVGAPGDGSPLDETVRRVVDRVGLALMDDLEQLAANIAAVSAGAGRGPEPGGSPFFRRFRELAAEEDLADLAPPVDGRRVMAELGLPPGPAVGRALSQLRQHRLAGGPMTAEEALAFLRAAAANGDM
ncbi:MAG: CCA tRNA nucleotidyltransferase [Acidimicrobiales bacterium]